MSKGTSKRLGTLIIAIAIIIVFAGVVIGLTAYREARKRVEVFPASLAATTALSGDSAMEGLVTSEVYQPVYVSAGNPVTEVLVYEGQHVSVGDELASCDMTLLELQNEIVQLDISILKTNISKAESELAVLKRNYSAQINAVLPSSAPSPSPSHTTAVEAARDTQQPLSSVSPTLPITEEKEPEALEKIDKTSEPYAGAGTEEDPYLFFIRAGALLSSDFITKYALPYKTEPLYLRLEVREGNEPDGEPLCWWNMVFKPDGTFDFQLEVSEELIPPSPSLSPSPSPTPSPTPSPSPSPSPTPSPSHTGGGGGGGGVTVSGSPSPSASPTPTPLETIAEIKLAYVKLTEKLGALRLDLSERELTAKELELRLQSGAVVSTIDGMVTGLIDIDEAESSGEPLMTIIGGSGRYVRGSVSEFDLSAVALGQEVELMSYATGERYTGVIVDIGSYPTGAGRFVEDYARNLSYYPFTVYVSEEAELSDGEYVELTLAYAETPEEGALYLEKAYVREDEEGRSYVLADDGAGRLERRYVETGDMLWGYYIEIRDGLSGDDFITFPYGDDVREGRRTTIVSGSAHSPALN